MKTGKRLRWQEPWFFTLRMRNRSGWRRKGYLMAAIFVAMMVGWYLDQHYGKGLRIGLPGALAFNLFIAIFLGLLNDLGAGQVEMGEEYIARSFVGHHLSARSWRYADIKGYSILSPTESGYEFGLLLLLTNSEVVTIGLPRDVRKEDLDEILAMHGIRGQTAARTDMTKSASENATLS